MLTDYHAKLIAHDLTRRCASDSVEKLTAVLSDAQVDLNPHQIDAALFAFRNPLSRGAILADEVGLGKTIEAGLLIAQMWAERKRRVLVIAPANLRKQWSQELADKFFLSSAILENRTFNEFVKAGNLNPFQQDTVVICSYQFARKMEPYLRQTRWDLVVIDEAHRLRNVYKPTNKIANSIKQAVAPYRKVLLTATPLQNSLLELYGLVSIIDDYAFGDLKAYRARFTRLGDNNDFHELKERLKPVCKRTLRKQVLEYVKYTDRHALVQEFTPSPEEQRLYDLVSEYLQQPTLYALPASQRSLMTLILRKLLASSTYAISDTLQGLAAKLDTAAAKSEAVDAPPADLPDNLDEYDELADEWDGDDADGEAAPTTKYSPEQLAELRTETAKLREFHQLAKSITKNSKGEVLLTALRKGFAEAAKAQERQADAAVQQKAIVFTESRRTQEYLFRILEQTEFAGKVMVFNGTNSDPNSKTIYQKWLTKNAGTDRVSGSPGADMRAALVEHFRDEASIMIATEAAAEGINLQFCNLVVNYDLPWNPQRIEQRIGRCHRYGQKCDVVVVNFLNKNNAADKRVYELLDQKFRLFHGVFGSSDEILGAVESGVDFEKRIATIYQKCRTPEQIQFEFDELQRELDAEIAEGQRDAREKLLDNFDQEVVEKVRIESKGLLDRFNERLWLLTKYLLADHARFDQDEYSFYLTGNPFPGEAIHAGPYRLGRNVEDANTYRVGHPLAQRVLDKAKTAKLPAAQVTFDYSGARKNISVLAPLVGKSGWLSVALITVNSFDTEESVILTGISDDDDAIDDNQCRRLFDLVGAVGGALDVPADVRNQLQESLALGQTRALDDVAAKNGHWFDVEMEKLDRWAEDRRAALKAELDVLERDIRDAKKAARQAPNLPEKLELQRKIRALEAKYDEALPAYKQAGREIYQQKESLLDEIARRLEQKTTCSELFTVRWRVV
jgi:ERCC4-related helicase